MNHFLTMIVLRKPRHCAVTVLCGKSGAYCQPVHRVFVLLVALFSVANAQSTFWPDVMEVPVANEASAEDDSAVSSISLTNKTSLTQVFGTQNRLDWQRKFGKGVLTQTADYRYNQNSSKSSIQYIDFSGMMLYNDVFFKGAAAGVDWSPILSYTRNSTSSTTATETIRQQIVQSNADIGPVWKHSMFSIPYTVRGGIYGYGWIDTLQSMRSTTIDDLHGKPGVYGSVTIADPHKPVGTIPLFVDISADGRALSGIKLGRVSSSILYCKVLPQLGDSLFFHVGDSITNGKELYKGGYEGKSFYSNASWRINHSFSGMAGLKMIERFGVAPRVYYRYFVNSLSYPEKTLSLDDQRISGSQFGISMASSLKSYFSYSGGIDFKNEFEDKLFKREFSSTTVATKENSRALIVNLSDHYSTTVRTDNNFHLRLPHGLSSRYRIAAFKDSKHYPFTFYDSTAEIRYNRNELDRVQIDNELSCRFDRDSLFFVELFGQFRKSYHYYYRKERSAESFVSRKYRIGSNFGFSAGPVTLMEKLYGDAEVTENRYAVNLPPYSRDIYSSLSGKVVVVENRLQVTGKWIEEYHDNGVWYGKEFWPDSVETLREFYAIQDKKTSYRLDFALESFLKQQKWKIGTVLTDFFQRYWDSGGYVVDEEDAGYGIEPYCRFEWQTSHVIVSAQVKRIFNTRDPFRYALGKNWDISLSGQMVF